MSTEFELKYCCPPTRLRDIWAAHPGDWAETPMSTTYYDTPAAALSQRRWTLRHRKEGSTDVCTLKTPGDRGARGEWELECDDIFHAVPHLTAVSGCAELAQLAESGLVAACGARFTRLSRLLELEGCTAELALDEGVLLGGGREIPLCEVELELKSGSRDALAAFAREFQARFGLSEEPRSKFARAKALAQED